MLMWRVLSTSMKPTRFILHMLGPADLNQSRCDLERLFSCHPKMIDCTLRWDVTKYFDVAWLLAVNATNTLPLTLNVNPRHDSSPKEFNFVLHNLGQFTLHEG